MEVARLLELKKLSQKQQVYKVNCPNDEFLCKPLYVVEKQRIFNYVDGRVPMDLAFYSSRAFLGEGQLFCISNFGVLV